jgi:hypothetical protein
MFRDSFKHRRCIIPASGLFEWADEADGKQLHLFTAADGSPILAFAGLWDRWIDPATKGRAKTKGGIIPAIVATLLPTLPIHSQSCALKSEGRTFSPSIQRRVFFLAAFATMLSKADILFQGGERAVRGELINVTPLK